MNKYMTIERYNVTLDSKVVKDAKKKMGLFGGKLSPIINNLLVIWLKYTDEVDKLIRKSKEENKKD